MMNFCGGGPSGGLGPITLCPGAIIGGANGSGASTGGGANGGGSNTGGEALFDTAAVMDMPQPPQPVAVKEPWQLPNS